MNCSPLRRPALRGTTALAAGALVLTACGSDPDDFPERPIEIIVPFSAGGGTDQIARALARAAETTCGTQITINNEEGGSGTVGLRRALNSPADGYTVAIGTTSTLLATHHGVSDTTPDDLTPLLQFNFDYSVLSVRQDSPYETIEDFLADAENLTVATSGTGSVWELSFIGMADAAGVGSPTNIPYDGAAPAIVAVLGGEADATSASGVEALSQIESEDLRPLASMSAERLPFLPDTPTLHESGVDWESGVWRGVVAPADIEDDVAEILTECFAEAAEDDAFVQFMETQEFEIEVLLGDDFAAMLNDEFAELGELVGNG